MKITLSDRREAWRILKAYSPELRSQQVKRALIGGLVMLFVGFTVIGVLAYLTSMPLKVGAALAGGIVLWALASAYGGLMFCPLVEALEARTLRERQTGPAIPAAPAFDC